MNKQFDLIIIGGGIAGLWTLAAARQQGIKAIAFEKNSLGGAQSIASQGIIHGGLKYSLTGSISNATKIIANMPKIWLDAHQQKGEVDLSSTTILSQHQYLIPATGIDSKLLSFLGSKTMASYSQKIPLEEAPTAYHKLIENSHIFELHEPVFAVNSVFESLQKQYTDTIYHQEIKNKQIKKTEQGYQITLADEVIECNKLLLACGEGFSEFSSLSKVKMQKRALHMVMVKGKSLPNIYAHFIGRSSKPLLTITSHPKGEETVWYLGGNLAETGTTLSSEQQIKQAQKLLLQLLPSLKEEKLEYASFSINRAEPKQSNMLRPDDAFVHAEGNLLIGWPTKLALAPRLAEKVLEHVTPSVDTEQTLTLPQASVANYRWHSL